jgi:hypothetical protein
MTIQQSSYRRKEDLGNRRNMKKPGRKWRTAVKELRRKKERHRTETGNERMRETWRIAGTPRSRELKQRKVERERNE